MEAWDTYARSLGIGVRVPFPAELLEPEERVRALCREDKCGNFGRHYMCPPHVGTLEQFQDRFRRYQNGLLLQFERPLDVRNDREGVIRSKVDFHRKILKMEQWFRQNGHPDAWGLIGGDCALCEQCLASTGEPCPYPEEARPSLESMAVDVLQLLARYDLDNAFHADKITWTGCVLY